METEFQFYQKCKSALKKISAVKYKYEDTLTINKEKLITKSVTCNSNKNY